MHACLFVLALGSASFFPPSLTIRLELLLHGASTPPRDATSRRTARGDSAQGMRGSAGALVHACISACISIA
jgi:hypothetical protein